jgi:hypothetical protein
MNTHTAVGSKQLWAGRIVSALVVLALLGSGAGKLSHQEAIVTDFIGKFGYPETVLGAIGATEILCALLYAIPQTSVLGAILLTGYFGGAIATHVRIEEAFVPPLMIGVLIWLGLYLRTGALRALVPWKKS